MTVGLTVGLPLASVVMNVGMVTSSTVDDVPLLEALCRSEAELVGLAAEEIACARAEDNELRTLS